MLNNDGIKLIEKTAKFPGSVCIGHTGCSAVWMPGDGTRYTFLFTKTEGLLAVDGCTDDTILGTVLMDYGLSMTFIPGGCLDFDYVTEKLSGLVHGGTPSSIVWAFVAVANWLYGSVEYGKGAYAAMAERYRFENLLKQKSE